MQNIEFGVVTQKTIINVEEGYPLKTFAPVDENGEIANNGDAYGIVIDALGIGEVKQLVVMTAGCIDKICAEQHYGESYSAEAISALENIVIFDNHKIGGGGGGGKTWKLLKKVVISETGVLSITIDKDENGTSLANLDVQEFFAFNSLAYGTPPDYKFYMTKINNAEIAYNMAITSSLLDNQRRSMYTFLGDGTLVTNTVDGKWGGGTATLTFRGTAVHGSIDYEYAHNFGNCLTSYNVYLYNGDFAVGSIIWLWGLSK